MKIRNGFVSNSSSSSFVLFGVKFDRENTEMHQIAQESGLEVIYGEDDAYVGLIESGEIEHGMVGDMRGDETRIQFQERIKNALPEKIREKAQRYSENWYNG